MRSPFVVGVALAIATPVARANTAAQPTDAPIPGPLVTEQAAWRLRGNLELTLDNGRAGRPFSIAPDVWYGVTPRLTVGVIHSFAAVGLLDAGGSLCFRAAPGTCDHVYRGSGLDVLWSWIDGALAIAPHARFLVRDIDPWKPAITAGAAVRWTRGRFAISGDPYVRFGLANQGRGNRATVVAPLWLGLSIARTSLALHTGWDGELATWRDGWHVPVGLAVTHRLSDVVDLGAEAGFPHLLGPQNNVKIRAATVFAEVRM